MTAEHWTEQRERSNRFALILIVWIARRLGRTVARLILRFVVLYYLLTAPAARTASRRFLRRVLDRPPGWRNVYRHFFYFAATILDRVYLFGGRADMLDIRLHGRHLLHRHPGGPTGTMVIVAHLGSFEMMRVLADVHGGLRLRALIDRGVGAKANAVFDAINPALRATLIDTSESDVDRVLKVKAALDRGEVVSVMADRYRPGDRITHCRFLGDPAPLPLSPWLLAGLMRARVVIGFGLYRGGNRYDLYFEEFAERFELPRARRTQLAQGYAQAYADRLAEYTRQAPYNWFNFFDFWRN